MLHQMKLHDAPFQEIFAGRKTIELRLYDEKRQQIKIGDEICFTNSSDPNHTIAARVTALHRFDSFAELYAALPLERCGYRPEEVASASPKDMELYYSSQEQAQYGVVGIELQVTARSDRETKGDL